MESSLLKGIKNGDELAYNTIFNQYYALLTSFAFKYLKDLDASKEIAQNTFVKLFEKRDSIEITTSLKSYLYKIVHNSCINYIKSRAIEAKHYSALAGEVENTSDFNRFIEQTEEEYRIYKAIDQLPGKCKLIFKLSRFEGRKNKDIADELNISVRTVETQISKAIKILKLNLKFIVSILF